MIQLILAAALALPGPAALQVQDRSPRPVNAVKLRSSPRNPQLTIAVNPAGVVLRSVDAGLTFTATPLAVSPTNAAVVHFDAGGVAYVTVTGASVWVSADAGQSWIERTTPGSLGFFKASLHQPLEVWCSTSQGEIFKSVDAAVSWNPVGLTLPGGTAWITHDTELPGTTLVGRLGSSIWSTDDGGVTWAEASIGSGYGIPVSRSNRWFRVSHFTTHNGGFYDVFEASRTADSWELYSYWSTLELAHTNLAPDPWSENSLIVQGANEVMALDLTGGGWSGLVDVPDGLRTDGIAFPGDDAARLLISSQLGLLEARRGNGPARLSHHGGASALGTTLIKVDPTDPEHLVSQSGSAHVLESFDGGVQWEVADAPVERNIYGNASPSEIRIDASGRLLLRSSNDPYKIWRRTGADWAPIASPKGDAITAFGGLVGSPDLLVAATVFAPGSELSVSTDDGATWSTQPIALNSPSGAVYNGVRVRDVHVTPGPGPEPRIVITGWGYETTAQYHGWVVAYTDDLGLTYTIVTSDYETITLAANPRHPEQIAIGFETIRPIEYSTDGLTTRITSPASVAARTLAVGSVTPGLLVRGDYAGGIFESPDWGSTWMPIPGLPQPNDIEMRASEEGYLVASSAGVWENILAPPASTTYCSPAVINSTGGPATLTALGSPSITGDSIRLDAQGLPQASATLFLASMSSGFVAQPGGSFGNLCLGSSIGRYQGDVQFAGPTGSATLFLDPNALAQPTGSIPAVAGIPWFFQAWFRDSVSGQSVSNFTDGCRIDWAN